VPGTEGGIIAAVDDLFFGVKIQETARARGIPVRLVRSPEEAERTARAQRPALVIVDLQSETCRPLELIRRLKADPTLGAVPILGYVAHVRDDLRRAAREAGCDAVVPRSAFSVQLPEMLQRYAPTDAGPDAGSSEVRLG
jgi:CheY-like chemotaxis protein